MTNDSLYPSSGSESPSTRGGWGADLRTFLTGALIPFAAGLLVLVGYLLLGNFFGGLLGAVGAVFLIIWWRSLHGKVFSDKIPTKSVVILTLASVGLFVLVLALR